MARITETWSYAVAWMMLCVSTCVITSCSAPAPTEYVRVLEHLADISDRHQDNCLQMGRALLQYLNGEKSRIIRDYQDHLRRLAPSDRDLLSTSSLKPRVKHAMERLVPGSKKCAEDAGVAEAYQQIWKNTAYATKRAATDRHHPTVVP